MADEPLFTFYGAALTGKKPQHKVSVPAGRMLLLKQAALGPKPPANARATLSVQCDEYPQLVLCTLSTAMPQALIEVVCSNDATLTFEGTPGSALHVCGVIMDPPSKREKAGQRAPTGASAAAAGGDSEDDDDEDIDDDDDLDDGEDGGGGMVGDDDDDDLLDDDDDDDDDDEGEGELDDGEDDFDDEDDDEDEPAQREQGTAAAARGLKRQLESSFDEDEDSGEEDGEDDGDLEMLDEDDE